MVLMGIIVRLFHLNNTNFTNLPKNKPLPVLLKPISSGNVDITFSRFLEAAATAIFDVMSKARPGFFIKFFWHFLIR